MHESDGMEDDDDSRGMQSLMLMVGDLAKYVGGVAGEVKSLQEQVKEVEAKLESAMV